MLRAAAVALAAVVAANAAATRVFHSPFPPPGEVRLARDEAVQNVSLMALGMRRLAADLAFIQLLMYYGGEDEAAAPAREEHDPSGSHEGHAHGPDYGKGEYPQMAARTERMLDLDPFFTYGALYSAGALAFNINRPEDALRVLRHAAARNPKEWKFRSYAVAVGFHKKGNPAEVVAEEEDSLHELEKELAKWNESLKQLE